MKRQPVDYRGFRLSRLTDPRFSHLLLLLGWVGYFVLFFLTERLIPTDTCTPIYSPLDDLFPFLEIFVIPYVGWYLLIIGSLWYFARYNVDGFKRMQLFIMLVQGMCMVIYILFPTRQDLRPAEFPRDNLLTDAVAYLYSIDTNTNVCPSMHVGYSLGIASVWLKDKAVPAWWKSVIVIVVALICLSTVFIKQHSVLDFFAALPVCLVAEAILYGKSYWLPRLKHHT